MTTSASPREALVRRLSSSLAEQRAFKALVERKKADAVRRSFDAFLHHWRFAYREPAEEPVGTFETLWPGQHAFADLMQRARWIVDLKAGKQGHSELECAWDAYASWSGPSNNRVHIYSQVATEAKEFLAIVRFGLLHLPAWFGVRLLGDEAGGDTAGSIRYRVGDDDVRTIVAYPARPDAGISQSAYHVHLDEAAAMVFGEEVYGGASTTVVPGGSMHVVSRGKSPDDIMAQLWNQAVPEGVTYEEAHAAALADVAAGNTKRIVPLFVDWRGRPDRDDAWYAVEAETRSPSAMRHYAPSTPEEALSGDADAAFVEEAQWDTLEVVAPIEPGDRTPLVLSLDAGVRSDHFAVVGVTRCPSHPEEAAIRYAHEWIPNPIVDFAEVKAHLRQMFADYNVICVVYDKYALEDMSQELGSERWFESYDQGARRLVGDASFRQRIVERRMARINHDALRAAVVGAGYKLDKDSKKLRIVKRTTRKVDLAVAAAMACDQSLSLNL
jgi:hypothetical protein